MLCSSFHSVIWLSSWNFPEVRNFLRSLIHPQGNEKGPAKLVFSFDVIIYNPKFYNLFSFISFFVAVGQKKPSKKVPCGHYNFL